METGPISLMIAVLTASALGSGHCVGMCGPFAVLAVRNGSPEEPARWRHLAGYHLGRAFTYAFIGVIAGWTGSWVDFGGDLLGWQQLAGWCTGVAMILFGFFALLRLFRVGSVHFALPSYFAGGMRTLYRSAGQLPSVFRAPAIGAVTGFLPCGWLYAFVLLAVGTSTPLLGALVMLAFWAGTIPALSLLSMGLNRLSDSGKAMLPYATAVMLIVGGIFTVSVRAYAEFSGTAALVEQSTNVEDALENIQSHPLPCCHSATEPNPSEEDKPLPPCCQQ